MQQDTLLAATMAGQEVQTGIVADSCRRVVDKFIIGCSGKATYVLHIPSLYELNSVIVGIAS